MALDSDPKFGEPYYYPSRPADDPFALPAQLAREIEQFSPFTPTEPTASDAVCEKTLTRLFPEVDWTSFDELMHLMSQALVAVYLVEGEQPSTYGLHEYLWKSGLVLSPADPVKSVFPTSSSGDSGYRRSSVTSSDTPESDSSSPSPRLAGDQYPDGRTLVYDLT